MENISSVINESKTLYGKEYPKKGGVFISSTHNGISQYRPFELGARISAEDAAELLTKIIDNSLYKKGRAELFWSGNAGFVLFDDKNNKIGILMYNRSQKTWSFMCNNYNQDIEKSIEDALDIAQGFDKLIKEDLEILKEIRYGRLGTSSIPRKMSEYIHKTYKEVDRNVRGGIWYRVYTIGTDSKYGAFLISPTTHEWRHLNELEFAD